MLSSLGCFASFWPDNDQKMDGLLWPISWGQRALKQNYYITLILLLFILFAVGLQVLGPVMNPCSTSQLQALFLHLLHDRYSVLSLSGVLLTM